MSLDNHLLRNTPKQMSFNETCIKTHQLNQQLLKVQCSGGSANIFETANMKSNAMLVPVASRHECHDIPPLDVWSSLTGARAGVALELVFEL